MAANGSDGVDPVQLPGFGLRELELARFCVLLLYTCIAYYCCLERHADLPPLRAREADGAAGARRVSASKDEHRGRQLEPREAIGDVGTTARAARGYRRRGDDSSSPERLSETWGRQLEPHEAIGDVVTTARVMISLRRPPAVKLARSDFTRGVVANVIASARFDDGGRPQTLR